MTPIWKRRWVLVALAVVVVLVAAVAIVVPMLLDVERYRPRIAQALRDATGWEPELGSIDVGLFPRPSVHVGASRLDSPHGESSIAIDSLGVAASLLPLFKGTLDIEDVTLDGPRITLVREPGDEAWDIPLPAADESAQPAAAGRGSAFDVEVRRIRLRRGELHIEDRSATPARHLVLDDVTIGVLPATGAVDGSARLAPDGGSLGWEGTFTEGITLTVESLATGRLEAIVGSELLRPGGTLDGTVKVSMPFAVDGTLEARSLALASGEAPLERADLTFRVVPAEDGLRLESTRLVSGALTMQGAGPLTPALDLAFRVPDTPLEPALEGLRAVIPFPLDVRGPGTANVDVKVFQDTDGEIRYSANGRMAATTLVGAEFVPPAQNLKTTFDLNAAGRLTVDVSEGTVAGGPMRGKVVLDRVDPPGTLRFDGTLRGASMGGMLAGFVADAAEKIVGPTSVQAAVQLDLVREVLDARALGGTVALTSGRITLPGWDVEKRIENELTERLARLDLTSLLDEKKTAKLGTSDVPVAFDTLRADVGFRSIPWSLDNLRLTRDGTTLEGGGSFDPLEGTIAVDLAVQLSASRSAKLVADHRALRALAGTDGRIRLPLAIQGSLAEPGIDVDLGNLARGILGKELGKEDVRKDLFDKLKKLVDDDD